MNEISCKTCDKGALAQQKTYRMSGPVVTIGYILLIPSILGILASVGFLVLTWIGAGFAAQDPLSESTVQRLEDAAVPSYLVERLQRGVQVSDASLATLDPDQRVAVELANTQLRAAPAAAGSLVACGLAMVGAILSLVGGLLGWLLIMKKTALVCDNCGATVAAS